MHLAWPSPRYKQCTQLHGVTIDQRLDVRRRVQLIINGMSGLLCDLKRSRSRFVCPSLSRRQAQRPGLEDCFFLFQVGTTVREFKVLLHGRPGGDLNLALQEVVLREPHLDVGLALPQHVRQAVALNAHGLQGVWPNPSVRRDRETVH
ncbi:hypothetical protein H310_10566 [Aphanomyces invadans]|uniref:Uncharacterized protein n=1 Tax=Aphanomyces invadans TaxID=157072 RepID=A0A024TQM8_9STRA|nr:hypothetical protein H310_10566 [Aphanomyces invadans]ETV95901.1 hypothetical protein H310_10566 [Aphanomyces invadans]|eukprot:XP_008875212.1 hypothetical protein H310_10566 [Aphanomyces invadans]